jgi:lactoylglutathione lyase
VLVRSLDAANKFYAGILGFQEFWRGNPANAKTLSWVNMRVPDGRDYIELMLYDKPQSADETGTKNHISLTVPDAEKAVAILKQRAAKVGYTREIVAKTGVNRKRQVNLYDPDGSRVELMEPDTVDGQPAPSSTLAPPQ